MDRFHLYRMIDLLGRPIVLVVLLLTLFFLILPIVITIIISFDPRSYLAYLPPPALSVRWYESFLRNPNFMQGLRTSVVVGGVSTLISTVLGIFASYGLVRYDFRGKESLNNFFLSPLVVPSVVTGFALLGFLSTVGIRGSLERLMIAHVIITLPYTIRTVSATLTGFDRSLEEAALNLGATPVRTFLDVTLPMIKFGVVAGAVFAFAMSLDDVSVSIFLADAFSSTLPVNLFAYMKSTFDPTVAAASVLLMGFTVGIIIVIEKVMGLDKFVGIGV